MFERHLLEEALTSCGGRMATASDLLQVPKKTLYHKLKSLGLGLAAHADDYRLP